MSRSPLLSALLLLLATPAARSEVVASAAHGFQLRHEAAVSADPETVFAGFSEIREWWNPAHSFSGDAENLSLDPRPRGCFCEVLEDGGGVVHLTVVQASPGKRLVLSGGLGPLQELPVTGTMTWSLAEAEGGGTDLAVSYGAVGFLDGGLEGWAGPVDGVIGEQFQRFVRWLETGSADDSVEGSSEGPPSDEGEAGSGDGEL